MVGRSLVSDFRTVGNGISNDVSDFKVGSVALFMARKLDIAAGEVVLRLFLDCCGRNSDWFGTGGNRDSSICPKSAHVR